MKFKGCGALLSFNLEGKNSSTPNPRLVQHSFIREQPWFQTRGLLFWGPVIVLWLLMMLSKLQLSPLFLISGRETKREISRSSIWFTLAFHLPKLRGELCTHQTWLLRFRKFGLCLFETLQKNSGFSQKNPLLKNTFEGNSQPKRKFTGKQKRISPTAYYRNNWERFNSAACLTWRSPLAVLWCLGNKSFHRTN